MVKRQEIDRHVLVVGRRSLVVGARVRVRVQVQAVIAAFLFGLVVA